MTIDKSSCPEQYSFIPFSFDVYRFWYLFDQRGRPDGLVHKPNIMIVLSIYNNISQSTIIITVLCGRIQCKPSAIYNHRVTDSGQRFFFRKYYLCIAIKDDRSRSSRKAKNWGARTTSQDLSKMNDGTAVNFDPNGRPVLNRRQSLRAIVGIDLIPMEATDTLECLPRSS